MPLHRLENGTPAAPLVARSDARLEGFLQAGDLTGPCQVLALFLLTGGWAHKVVLGKVGKAVDSEWLESRRTSWTPVKDLLKRANERARRQDYEEAAAWEDRSGLSDPRFQDSLAAFGDAHIRVTALAFVLTGASNEDVRAWPQA